MKDLLLGEMGGIRAALFPVDQTDALVGEWLQHPLQPIRINRVHMRASHHNNGGCGMTDAQVQRSSEGEFLRRDRHDLDGVLARDFPGVVR